MGHKEDDSLQVETRHKSETTAVTTFALHLEVCKMVSSLDKLLSFRSRKCIEMYFFSFFFSNLVYCMLDCMHFVVASMLDVYGHEHVCVLEMPRV